MRNWYFYQERGQTLGPLTVDDLRERIRNQVVRHFDLIYKEGEPGWRMAQEYPEFQAEFKGQSDLSAGDRPWVCLVRKSPDDYDFVTRGPYSTDEIRQQLREGVLTYSDFAWQSGFSEWTRIGTLPEFGSKKRSVDDTTARVITAKGPEVNAPPQTPKTGDAEYLLRNVVELKRGRPAEEPKPFEDAGQDLTKIVRVPPPPSKSQSQAKKFDPEATRIVTNLPNAPAPTTAMAAKRANLPPIPDQDLDGEATVIRSQDEVLQLKRPRKRRKKSLWWMDWGIVAGLVLLLVAAVIWSTHRLSTKEAVVAPPILAIDDARTNPELSGAVHDDGKGEVRALPPVVSPTDQGRSPKPIEPMQDEVDLPGKKAAREPSQLTLKVNIESSENARIEVRSDGTSEFPVYLQIIGLPGQLAEVPSFYRYLKLRSTGDLGEPIALPQLKLPQGRFVLRAESGTLKREAQLNLGVGEANFKQAVARARKTYSAAVWSERLRLYNLIVQAEPVLAAAVSGKPLVSKGFDFVLNLRKSTSAGLIFYDDWWELRQILTAARANPTGEQLDRLKRLRERMASFSVWRKS